MAIKKKSKILSYYAVFEPAQERGFNVSFPDFPGCVTFGRNFEEAEKAAKEVLELWLEELAAQNSEIPIYHRRPLINEIQVSLPSAI